MQVDKEESPPLPTESDFDSEPEVMPSKKSKASEPEETSLPKKKKTKTKHASNTSVPVTDSPLSGVPDEKTMKGKGRKLSKPSKTSGSSKAAEEAEESIKSKIAKFKHSPQPPEPTPGTNVDTPMADEDFPPATSVPVPAQQTSVGEDDINAEVDARLAAKEAKRAKKKEAKKRKRDSVASDIFSPDPKAEPAHITPLPAKKKARLDRDDGDVKEQRQNVDDTLSSKGKTKKQKTSDTVEKEEKNDEVNKANKAKRRRSSNAAVPEAPVAAPQTNRNKKRKVGF